MKGIRYFVDLRTGAMIFVVHESAAREWPPPGYPVTELSEEVVEHYLYPPDEEKE